MFTCQPKHPKQKPAKTTKNCLEKLRLKHRLKNEGLIPCIPSLVYLLEMYLMNKNTGCWKASTPPRSSSQLIQRKL
jgi:hypothetical protein